MEDVDAVVERSLRIEIEGRTICCPTPEDFIIMKAVDHRPLDLEDIRNVIAVHPDLDVGRIERWVKGQGYRPLLFTSGETSQSHHYIVLSGFPPTSHPVKICRL